MNSAYKHLDSKLKIAELTIGQWIGVILGMLIGIVWALYLSPLGQTLTITTAVYLAAIPIGAALSANFTEFNPALVIRSAIAWRRREGRFIPGPGASARGYVVLGDPAGEPPANGSGALAELDFAALWEVS
jgi:hypothetical protein